MYIHWTTFSLAFVCWMSADGSCRKCSHRDYFWLYGVMFSSISDDNSLTMRPSIDNKTTMVSVSLFMTSITDVNEKAQTISTKVKIFTLWEAQTELWDPAEYCDIETITARKELLWTPDIVITESIKTEFASKESPYVQLDYKGLLNTVDILSVTSACKMDLYMFPFDTQICNLTLQSFGYSVMELNFREPINSTYLTSESLQNFQTKGEWELLNINASIANSSTMGFSQNINIFQITIKRRPLLYIINLIFPVFCFLVLDVASFFINASETEKLGFKVTLLLSISVLLLILNDKLPSTASDMPLIGIYCLGVFSLIGISILETIFVSFLIAKGEETKPVTPTESGVDVTVQHGGVEELHNSLDTVTRTEKMTCTSDILKQILMEFRAFTHQHQQKVSPGWTSAARIVNVIFIVLYVITVIVFLSFLGKVWFKF